MIKYFLTSSVDIILRTRGRNENQNLRFVNSKFQSFLLSYKKSPVLSIKDSKCLTQLKLILIYLSICYDVVKGKVFNRKLALVVGRTKGAAFGYGRSAVAGWLAQRGRKADSQLLQIFQVYRYQMIAENNKTGKVETLGHPILALLTDCSCFFVGEKCVPPMLANHICTVQYYIGINVESIRFEFNIEEN